RAGGYGIRAAAKYGASRARALGPYWATRSAIVGSRGGAGWRARWTGARHPATTRIASVTRIRLGRTRRSGFRTDTGDPMPGSGPRIQWLPRRQAARGVASVGVDVLYRVAMELSMPLEEAMRSQRAIRRLKTDPVDDALVLHLIDLALKAPTGRNAPWWKSVVVGDRAGKDRLGTLTREAWSLCGGIGRRLYRNDPTMLRIMNAVQWQADHFADIPVLVIPCLRGF